MSSDADRRRYQRLPIELKVEYKRLNMFFADFTKNISKGGTFIKTSKALDVGTEFIFSLTIPTLKEPIKLRGRVMWVFKEGDPPRDDSPEANEPGMGIRFLYESDAQRGEVNGVVEKLMIESLGPIIYKKLMESEP